ncbi:MAG: type II toxin-antitoxin system VapC family toxin [Acidobacteria bacterium]|nr:type II toxin-antitoxin system VapC family toxin [Acidobacteriota bacterium]
MVLESSAIVAIFQQEPGHELLEQKIDQAEVILIGAPTMTEIAIVMSRRSGGDYRPSLEAFLRRIDAQVVSFTEQHYSAASDAHLRFGRGINSKAALNYGDCLSYAVAKVAGQPLLFVGDDFAHTDIIAA